jgi:hypothetical protein
VRLTEASISRDARVGVTHGGVPLEDGLVGAAHGGFRLEDARVGVTHGSVPLEHGRVPPAQRARSSVTRTRP